QLRGADGAQLADGDGHARLADGAGDAFVDGEGGIPLPGGEGGAMLLGGPGRFTPTIYLYDNYPGGVGLSSPLYERRGELLAQARAVVADCDCQGGCPACVGPILELEEDATRTPRALALKVLDLLVAA